MADDLPAQEPELTLALSEDGRKLLASYTPATRKTPFDPAVLRQEIAAHGFENLHVIDSALEQFSQRCAASDEAFSLEIAEVRDAEAIVEVSADKMSALLSITPPCGGEGIKAQQILLALANNQVTHGFIEEAIQQAIASGSATQLEVARGRAPVDGTDGYLECLIEMVKSRHPHIDEHGTADFRDLGGVLIVHQGQQLMRKHPPTAGENGDNVLGQVVMAKPGKDIMFAPQLSGAMIDPQDPAVLVAEITGQPVQANYGMTVEPTITVPSVDLTTGNIDFEGTVNISGDVHAGMSIRATGDIHIDGTVEAAMLDAGGDVVVKGGIIGHGEIHVQPGKSDKTMIARVRCGASCSALFIENASVEAGDSIMIEKLAMQSELIATNQIVVGRPGSGQGHIIGGLIEATLLVQAGELGSSAGVRTRIMVGTNPALHENLKRAQAALKKKNHELEEVEKLLAFIAANPERINIDTRLKAEKTHTMLGQEIEIALQEINELALQLDLAEGARVVAGKTVYGNVQVEIGKKIHHVDIERGKGAFMLKEGEIVFE